MTTEPPPKRPRGLGAKKAESNGDKAEDAVEEIMFECGEGADEMTQLLSMWTAAKKSFWEQQQEVEEGSSEKVELLLSAVINEANRIASDCGEWTDELANIFGEAMILQSHYAESEDEAIKYLQMALDVCPEDSQIYLMAQGVKARSAQSLKDDKSRALALYHLDRIFGASEVDPLFIFQTLEQDDIPLIVELHLAKLAVKVLVETVDEDSEEGDSSMEEFLPLISRLGEKFTENLTHGGLTRCAQFHLSAGVIYGFCGKEAEEEKSYQQAKKFYGKLEELFGEQVPEEVKSL